MNNSALEIRRPDQSVHYTSSPLFRCISSLYIYAPILPSWLSLLHAQEPSKPLPHLHPCTQLEGPLYLLDHLHRSPTAAPPSRAPPPSPLPREELQGSLASRDISITPRFSLKLARNLLAWSLLQEHVSKGTMAEVEVAPTFGAELKVRDNISRKRRIATPRLTGQITGWLQARQRLGRQRHSMARRHPGLLPRAERHRERLRETAQGSRQQVL